ncbi:MAG: T9SS type A sorting domain-containing protein, partial [bacterium]
IGLSYLFMGFPSYNRPHDSLAIRFTPPESSAYQVHDVGIYSALSENSAGIFMYNGDNLTPWSKVKNFGNQTEANFPVCGWIKNQSGQTIYADTLQAGTLPPGEIDSMVFSPDWVASTNGQFTFTAKTSLTGDMYTGNDQSVVEMRVVTYPTELQYENIISTLNRYSWNGPGGYGNRFVPPQYPCRVTGMKVYSATTQGSVNIFVGVLDDNGPGGSPGDTLTSTTLNITLTAMWYTANFPNPVDINEGAFFIGAISSVASQPSVGMDTAAPFSRQGWEYTTAWAPSRYANIHDICIRALVQTVGIEEELTPAGPIPQTIVAPNPFRTQTLIKFANPQKKTVTLNIYNATGSRVKTLTAKNEEIIWHGRDDAGKKLADGIYFLKIEGGKENIEKLIIAH